MRTVRSATRVLAARRRRPMFGMFGITSGSTPPAVLVELIVVGGSAADAVPLGERVETDRTRAFGAGELLGSSSSFLALLQRDEELAVSFFKEQGR